MDDQRIWEIITKVLAGEANATEAEQLKKWLAAADENNGTFEIVRKIWQNADIEETPEIPSSEKSWLQLHHKIAQWEQEDQHHGVDKHKRRRIISGSGWISIAASVTIILMSYLYFWPPQEQVYVVSEVPKEKTIEAPLVEEVVTHTFKSEQALKVIYLPDSTKVWLNQTSALSYDDHFGQTQRSVTLHGEAFFDVKRDTSKPFIIATKDAEVQVLGTSFNVKSSDLTDQPTEVAVVSGEVAFMQKGNKQSRVLLRKGERAKINTDGQDDKEMIRRSGFKDRGFISWMKKDKLILEDEQSRPENYVLNHCSWEKNWINQSIVEGEIENSALFTTYEDIKLRYTIHTQSGVRKGPYYYTIFDKIKPGETLKYKYGLLDFFTKTDMIKVEVTDAKIIEQ